MKVTDEMYISLFNAISNAYEKSEIAKRIIKEVETDLSAAQVKVENIYINNK